jgi:hypothetical protein
MIDSLRARDPAKDAAAAFALGDRRLWAASMHIPGAMGTLQDLSREYGTRPMPYSGDLGVVVGSDTTHSIWQRAAYDYALAYNRKLLALVAQPGH